MRGARALLVAVIVMGVMILVGTAILISVVVERAMHGTSTVPRAVVIPQPVMIPQQASVLALDQPPGTRILSVVRQSDRLLAITLSGGGSPDRLLIWDVAAGRVVARLALDR